MLPIILYGSLLADGFDFGQWAMDMWHRLAADPDTQTHAILTLIALCLCKIAFGRKKPPPGRSKASLDLPEGESGYVQIGDDTNQQRP